MPDSKFVPVSSEDSRQYRNHVREVAVLETALTGVKANLSTVVAGLINAYGRSLLIDGVEYHAISRNGVNYLKRRTVTGANKALPDTV